MAGSWRRVVWVAYDHLGGMVLANLAWSLASLPWLLAGAVLATVGAAFGRVGALAGLLVAAEVALVSPPSALLVAAGLRWARGEDVGWRAMGAVARRLAWPAQVLGLILSGVTAVLAVNVSFYGRFGGWVGLALGGAAVWGLLGAGLVAVHLLPALVLGDGTVRHALVTSARLTIARPGLAVALLGVVIAVLGIGLVSGIGLPCGLLAFLGLLLGVVDAEALGWPGRPPLPDEPQRGLADLLHPWRA